MTTKYWLLPTWIHFLLISQMYGFSRIASFDLMKCSYGERGSLTATCVNAIPSFFKATLYKFDHLDETLQCVNCTLSSIDSNTFDLSGNQIKELNLQDSLIETLRPRAFMGLIFLKALNMSSNKIRSIFPGTFSGIKKIVTLDISKNEISVLSESGFAELVELENLILRENQIKVIDHRAFNGLAKLLKLDLSFNIISALNKTLENTTSLEVINLNHNAFHILSGNEFSSLNKLNEIDLCENLLNDESLSIYMTPGNQLRKISLAKNKIAKLWFRISHLGALEELDLRFNNISNISNIYSPFESMRNLQALELAYNNITEIQTGWFTGFPQLRTLNCSRNAIKQVLITGVFSLPNLNTLDLSHNVISDLDYTALISRVPALTYLRLDYNMMPCGLEYEMEQTFAEDNFKFILYEIVNGFPVCIEDAVSNYSRKSTPPDAYDQRAAEPLSAVDIVIFIFISLIIAAIVVLFYLQYMFFKGIDVSSPRRVASAVQLISSEADQKEDDDFDNRV